jgi:hypothetical protein
MNSEQIVPRQESDPLWRDVVLEVSLKPFRDLSEAGIRRVAEDLFFQWLPLWRHSRRISVLFWTSDGSELLDYDGDWGRAFEWARTIGGANPRKVLPDDPEKCCLHNRNMLYCENPPEVTYGDLQRIVRVVRGTGEHISGRPVRVGTTFDPGPEFARSDFKYVRHPEICRGGSAGQGDDRFVTCYRELAADPTPYAGFPDGIKAGTPFGIFLGRQTRLFCEAMGFDYVWFSNGFGFGKEPWRMQGALFDEETFNAADTELQRERVLSFWKFFREECPALPVEIRGTNLTVGVDLSTDAAPYEELLAGRFGFAAAPNSPWAAIDGDFGLELAGYMTRIAELPADAEGYPFRFYTHDPWWLNSPWLDRYERQPHDIYLPMSVARVGEDGALESPDVAEFLTADDSFGNMPDTVPEEVIPHLLEAVRTRPDAPGALTWVYPLSEYTRMVFSDEPALERVFCGDWLVRGAINQGLPLNTVVSSRIFEKTLAESPSRYSGTVLLSIVPPADSSLEAALMQHVRAGGQVLLYGPLEGASDALKAALNLSMAEPLEGEFEVKLSAEPDPALGGSLPRRIIHRAVMSGGGCRETLAETDAPGFELLAAYRSGDGAERAAALWREQKEWNGGSIGWVRGTNSMRGNKPESLPLADDPSLWLDGTVLFKLVFARFGWETRALKHEPEDRPPLTTISRRLNGFWFSGYVPDTNVALSLRTPLGAPLLLRWEGQLEEGRSVYRLPRAWREQCRVLVDGQQSGLVSCRIHVRHGHGCERRMRVQGLKGATVRFFPETGREDAVSFLPDLKKPFLFTDQLSYRRCESAYGTYMELTDVTGDLLISW